MPNAHRSVTSSLLVARLLRIADARSGRPPSAPAAARSAFHPIELLLEWETLKNGPRERRECGPRVFERWRATLGQLPLDAALRAPPELSIVLTTFTRPTAAEQLLTKLSGALERARLTEPLAQGAAPSTRTAGRASHAASTARLRKAAAA